MSRTVSDEYNLSNIMRKHSKETMVFHHIRLGIPDLKFFLWVVDATNSVQ